MSNLKIIRAWKDEEYRLGLSNEELSALPQNPAGLMELADLELGAIAGGALYQGAYPRSLDRADACSAACFPPRVPRVPPSNTILLGAI